MLGESRSALLLVLDSSVAALQCQTNLPVLRTFLPPTTRNLPLRRTAAPTAAELPRCVPPSFSSPQPVQEAADAAAARVAELQRGVADLTKRKQQLAARLAGLEQAVKSGR